MICDAPCREVKTRDEGAFINGSEDWLALLSRSYDNRIFLTPTWMRIWWHFFGSGKPHVLSIQDQDLQQLAILPLQVVDDEGSRVLTLLGDPEVFDYMDALAVKHEAQWLLTVIWSQALQDISWDRVLLRHIPSGSPLIAALQTVAAERDLGVSVEVEEVCPVALLCNSWEGYLDMLSKKQRHEIRRKLRRLQEGAEWSWRTAQTMDDIRADLPVFFRLHEASAHEKAGFMTPDMRAFFEGIAEAFLAEGQLRLCVLRRDGVDLAATLAFVYRGRYLLYNSGYDPAYASLSPGIVATALSMQDAIRERAVAFDFLSGNEAYKYQLGATDTHTCRVEIVL